MNDSKARVTPLTSRQSRAPQPRSQSRPVSATITSRAASVDRSRSNEPSTPTRSSTRLTERRAASTTRARLPTAQANRPPPPKTAATLAKENGELLAKISKLTEDAAETKKNLETRLSAAEAEIENLLKLLAENEHNLRSSVEKIDALKENLRESDAKARKSLNDLLNCKGQIRIVTRTRPALSDERPAAITYPRPDKIELLLKKEKLVYEFQKTMGPNYTQAAVFAEIGELVLNVLHGYNVAIIAYGQTGSGKTFTMRGGNDSDTEGITPRAIRFIFDNTKRLEDIGWTFHLSACFVEVYNNELYDLLAKTRTKVSLKAMEVVGELTMKDVTKSEQIEAILARADKNRSVGMTKLNATSSRSHAIFKLTIKSVNSILNTEYTSALHLVDLAGSERVKESGAEGAVLREAAEINESLFHFQGCIRALLEKTHVPFRNRTLTKLLSTCLSSDDSKTMVVVNLNPSEAQATETKRSLDFARDMSGVVIREARPTKK